MPCSTSCVPVAQGPVLGSLNRTLHLVLSHQIAVTRCVKKESWLVASSPSKVKELIWEQVSETTMHQREAMLTALAVALKCHPCGWTLHWGKKLRCCSMSARQHQKNLTEVSELPVLEEGAKFYFSSFLEKPILPMLCIFKLAHPRRSPKLRSSSWRAFNLLGKQWSQIFFNVALILLGKHLFTLGLTGSKWEVCMCPLTLQLTECEILGPRLLWTL